MFEVQFPYELELGATLEKLDVVSATKGLLIKLNVPGRVGIRGIYPHNPPGAASFLTKVDASAINADQPILAYLDGKPAPIVRQALSTQFAGVMVLDFLVPTVQPELRLFGIEVGESRTQAFPIWVGERP